MRTLLIAVLAISASVGVIAQPSGYRALEEFGDTSSEARHIRVFEAHAGDSVKTTLTHWSTLSGWAAPQWDLPEHTDFAMATTVRFEGDFKTATRSFVTALPKETGLLVRFDEPRRRAVVYLKPTVTR